jgi:hypothetical protein
MFNVSSTEADKISILKESKFPFAKDVLAKNSALKALIS